MRNWRVITLSIVAVAALGAGILQTLRVLQFDPSNVNDVSKLIADEYLRKDYAAMEKNVPAMLPVLEAGISTASPQDRAYFALFACYCALHNTERAAKCIAAAAKLAPDNVDYAVAEGVSLKMQGRNRDARDFYRTFERKHGESSRFDALVAANDMSIQDYSESLAIWKKILANQPEGATSNRAKLLGIIGKNYLYLHRQNEAVASLTTAVAMEPTETKYAMLGEALLKSGYARESISKFDLALAHTGDNAGALYYKGVALSKLGDAKGADALFHKALVSIDNSLADAGDEGEQHFLRGLIEAKLGNAAGARESFATAKKLGYTFEAPY